MRKTNVKTTEKCSHDWYHTGTNAIGTWWNCRKCDTTGLDKEAEVKAKWPAIENMTVATLARHAHDNGYTVDDFKLYHVFEEGHPAIFINDSNGDQWFAYENSYGEIYITR